MIAKTRWICRHRARTGAPSFSTKPAPHAQQLTTHLHRSPTYGANVFVAPQTSVMVSSSGARSARSVLFFCVQWEQRRTTDFVQCGHIFYFRSLKPFASPGADVLNLRIPVRVRVP
jgi:hypothetical protein